MYMCDDIQCIGGECVCVMIFPVCRRECVCV